MASPSWCASATACRPTTRALAHLKSRRTCTTLTLRRKATVSLATSTAPPSSARHWSRRANSLTTTTATSTPASTSSRTALVTRGRPWARSSTMTTPWISPPPTSTRGCWASTCCSTISTPETSTTPTPPHCVCPAIPTTTPWPSATSASTPMAFCSGTRSVPKACWATRSP
ncbi:hypothetical protein D3C84_910520 [compost metagenome]